jgi:hypothetical protein
LAVHRFVLKESLEAGTFERCCDLIVIEYGMFEWQSTLLPVPRFDLREGVIYA